MRGFWGGTGTAPTAGMLTGLFAAFLSAAAFRAASDQAISGPGLRTVAPVDSLERGYGRLIGAIAPITEFRFPRLQRA
jgi:hypothetical protein